MILKNYSIMPCYLNKILAFYSNFIFFIITLRNIIKGFSASITVYIDTKHCELKQCNGSPTLDTKSCKGNI